MGSGFTLLETLIALVISALLTLVVMDSLSAATGHAARLEAATRAHTERALALMPVRRALEGAAPDYHDGDAIFAGDGRQARGFTLAGANGAPGRFEIAIAAGDGAARLIYSEDGQALMNLSLPVEARLVFRDEAGLEHDVWPPPEGFGLGDPEYYRPVPPAVIIADGDRAILAVRTAHRAVPTLRVRDLDIVP